MKLDTFIPGVTGFALALRSGSAVQLNPAESLVVGSGLPVWPALALRHAVSTLPNPEALAMEVMRGIQLALPAVRGGALALQAVGGVATALSPVAGVVGPALAPALAAIPYGVGTALGAAATQAGPIVAAGGIGASVIGAVGGATPDPAALNKLGEDIAGQLAELERNNNVDAVIDIPKQVEL